MPGMDFLLGLVAGDWEEEDYREIGYKYLELCDALFVSSQSWGVWQEMARARQRGIPIFLDMEGLEAYSSIVKKEEK